MGVQVEPMGGHQNPPRLKLHSVQSKYVGEIFSIEMRKLTRFCEFCIDFDGCRLYQCEKQGYVKEWKYVPLNKVPHLILTWQEMHDEEAIISLDHDRVFDVVREGMCHLSLTVSSINWNIECITNTHFFILVIGDVFVVTTPLGHEENVTVYLM